MRGICEANSDISSLHKLNKVIQTFGRTPLTGYPCSSHFFPAVYIVFGDRDKRLAPDDDVHGKPSRVIVSLRRSRGPRRGRRSDSGNESKYKSENQKVHLNRGGITAWTEASSSFCPISSFPFISLRCVFVLLRTERVRVSPLCRWLPSSADMRGLRENLALSSWARARASFACHEMYFYSKSCPNRE